MCSQKVLAHEEMVHFLQLLLGQDEAVDLFLSPAARNPNSAHKHRSFLLLILGLKDNPENICGVKTAKLCA